MKISFLLITFAFFVFYASSLCFVFPPFVQGFKFSKLSKISMCMCYLMLAKNMYVCVSFMFQKCACNFSLKLLNLPKASIAFDVSP